jgi:hypothetical protein
MRASHISAGIRRPSDLERCLTHTFGHSVVEGDIEGLAALAIARIQRSRRSWTDVVASEPPKAP